MKDILELQEFFVEGKNHEKSHALLHITEPSTPGEEKKGYFFAIAELIDAKLEQIEHLQQIIDSIESGYYETEDEEGKSAFELTLEYINRRGHHLLNNKKSEIHCLVGAICDGNISFAYYGGPVAMVFYRGKSGYETLPVIEKDKQKNSQLFSSLMQGRIQINDYFFVSTPQVMEYIAADRIEKIITSRPIHEGASHIQKILANLRTGNSFGGIIFHLTTKDQLPRTGKIPAYLKSDSAGSLNDLISTQEITKETLNPPLFGKASQSLKEYLAKKKPGGNYGEKLITRSKTKKTNILSSQYPDKEEETNYRPREEKPIKEPIFSIILVGMGKALVYAGKITLALLQRSFILMRDILIGLFLITTNRGGQRAYVINKIKTGINSRRHAIAALPILSKILLAATIILALIFAGSIAYLKIKESWEAKRIAYENILKAINDKKEAASASMIYGDEERAFALLQEAKNLISQLPQKKEGQKNKALELNAESENLLMKLRKMETIRPDVLAELNPNEFTVGENKIILLGEKIIAYGPKNDKLFLIDKSTATVEGKEHNTFPTLLSASVPKEADMAVFLTSDQTIAQFNPALLTLSAKDISFPTDKTKLSDLVIYNRRAYTLDPAANQVYKHNPTQTGYDRGAPWVKSKADLSQAVSMTIDGDIFVLKKTGEIIKLVSGEKTSFSVSGLDPALDQPIAIWTYNNVDSIYILEPTNRRIVVLNKEGKLIKQYTAAEWQNPTGMTVDEVGGIIYVLDGNKIYKFNL